MRYDSLEYTSISGCYCWKSAEMERQDTPLFLTGSERKVNLASLKMAFFRACLEAGRTSFPLRRFSNPAESSGKRDFPCTQGFWRGAWKAGLPAPACWIPAPGGNAFPWRREIPSYKPGFVTSYGAWCEVRPHNGGIPGPSGHAAKSGPPFSCGSLAGGMVPCSR